MDYALVTGGSRGIGAAICKRLSAQGLSIIINYRSNEQAARAVADDIEAAGGVAELLPFDVSSEEAVDAAVERWETEHPDDRITVLVNNAGIREDNLLIFMQTDQWKRVIDTTLDGFFFVTRQALRSHNQRHVALRTQRSARSGQLFSRQGRSDWSDKGPCPGSGSTESDGQCRGSRLHQVGHDQGPR